MLMMSRTGIHVYICLTVFICFMVMNKRSENIPNGERFIYNSKNQSISYHRDMPLIFIGGMPRSGTTLMRAMLDAHPAVRCGEETHIIPRLIQMSSQMRRFEMERLLEAGITVDILNSAVSNFILEIIALHGEAAPYLCNKDPFTLRSTILLKNIFPKAKFIYMIRDGRGTVHSMISRQVTVSGFDLKDYRQCLSKWSVAVESMYTQCLQVGESRCMPVFYEQLVLHPELWMKRIMKFLDIPWDSAVLHHEDFIDKPGGISVAKTEASSDQIIKPVNLEALNKWVGNIPEDVVTDMAKIAPILQTLGYDPEANPPNYGKPDPKVANNTLQIKQNEDFWKEQEAKMKPDKPRKERGGVLNRILNNQVSL